MATAFLARIRTTLINYIESMTIAGGYFYNYPSADERDPAKLTLTAANAACWLNFGSGDDGQLEETSLDPEDHADGTAYHNTFPLFITSLASTALETGDPKENYKVCCWQMLEDFKKALGTNINLTAKGVLFWNEIQNIEYVGAVINWKIHKDALTPGVLVSQFKITYAQLRSNPNTIAI